MVRRIPACGLLLGWVLLVLAVQACGGGADEAPEDSAKIEVNGSGDKIARDGALTLREAMALATGELAPEDLDEAERGQLSGDPGGGSADEITFDKERFPQADPQTVALTDALPVLNAGFDVVDASERGVVVDGGQRLFPCFHLDSPGNELRGLVIQSCHTGVLLDYRAGANVVGQGNVISGNTVGIEIRGSGNFVRGNYIGLDPSGTRAVPNAFEGIWIAPGAKDNTIGGTEEDEGNVISGNDLFGVSVDGQGTSGNVLLGNLIGTDAAGRAAVPNKYGVVIQGGAQANTVGGDEPEAANVIAGNNTGVVLRDPDTRGNVVRGNYIGYAADGETPIENVKDLWTVDEAADNVVEGNVMRE